MASNSGILRPPRLLHSLLPHLHLTLRLLLLLGSSLSRRGALAGSSALQQPRLGAACPTGKLLRLLQLLQRLRLLRLRLLARRQRRACLCLRFRLRLGHLCIASSWSFLLLLRQRRWLL